jgi:hypothetical protein
MNSDTFETAEQCAKDTGVIVSCDICHDCNLSAGDGDTEKTAYGHATNVWKDG